MVKRIGLMALIVSGLLVSSLSAAEVARYKFDLNTNDSVGTNHGTLWYGMVPTNITIQPDWVLGKHGFGDAVSLQSPGDVNLDGKPDRGDYVQMNRPVQDNWTIAFWVKTTDAGFGTTGGNFWLGLAILDSDLAGFANDWGISLTTGGKVTVGTGNTWVSPDPAAWKSLSLGGATAINNGAWHHVAWTRDLGDGVATGVLTLYIDGLVDGTKAFAIPRDYLTKNAQALTRVGTATSADNEGLTGDVDDLRFYDNVLTQAQIQDLMVPEPATMLLLGLGALAAVRRRR